MRPVSFEHHKESCNSGRARDPLSPAIGPNDLAGMPACPLRSLKSSASPSRAFAMRKMPRCLAVTASVSLKTRADCLSWMAIHTSRKSQHVDLFECRARKGSGSRCKPPGAALRNAYEAGSGSLGCGVANWRLNSRLTR